MRPGPRIVSVLPSSMVTSSRKLKFPPSSIIVSPLLSAAAAMGAKLSELNNSSSGC
jgi:hypothetical protein